jgi:hypothetical protein
MPVRRLVCTKCKHNVVMSKHPDMGDVASCQCQNDFQSDFDHSLWEMQELDRKDGESGRV